MSFFLDYDTTYATMRKAWPSLLRYRDVFDEAFQDTFADYVELRDTIEHSHVAWFRYRMWNNVNQYEPFKSRNANARGVQSIPSFVSYMDFDAPEDLSPEDKMILEEEWTERNAEKWDIPLDTEDEVCKLLLEGYTRAQVTEILGYDYEKNRGMVVTRALNKERTDE